MICEQNHQVRQERSTVKKLFRPEKGGLPKVLFGIFSVCVWGGGGGGAWDNRWWYDDNTYAHDP